MNLNTTDNDGLKHFSSVTREALMFKIPCQVTKAESNINCCLYIYIRYKI